MKTRTILGSRRRTILFSRYPVAGQTKTRLIPALGAESAALLQKQMTEAALSTLEKTAVNEKIEIEIRYADGDNANMRNWLGEDFLYYQQGDGDLGEKMARAFADAFEQGKHQVVIVGADCPDISSSHLAACFALLNDHELVLGPACDGGYYLIGLNSMHSELFCCMPWGQPSLLGKTVKQAEALKLSYALLEPLNDIDRPEDLQHLPSFLCK